MLNFVLNSEIFLERSWIWFVSVFKMLLLVYKALHGLAPKYICDKLTYKQLNKVAITI